MMQAGVINVNSQDASEESSKVEVEEVVINLHEEPILVFGKDQPQMTHNEPMQQAHPLDHLFRA